MKILNVIFSFIMLMVGLYLWLFGDDKQGAIVNFAFVAAMNSHQYLIDRL